MDDNDELVDFSALINVLLPLDLYKQTPFPSEQSFDRLRQLIHAHFLSRSVTTSPRITQEFLFSICNILWDDTQSQIPREKMLPSVLRCIKLWRLLPSDEKNLDDAVERLALDLAGLVNCRAAVEADISHNSLKRLRVRWIGSDSEYAYVHRSTLSDGECAPGSPAVGVENGVAAQPGSPSGPAHVCLNIPHLHETAVFRNGCCCCRQPRTSISTSRASFALLPSVRSKPGIPVPQSSVKTSAFIPKDTPKTNSKVVDENVPPISSSAHRPVPNGSKLHAFSRRTLANNIIPSRSKSSRLSAISSNTPSRLSTSHMHMISRSSRSHTSRSDTQARPFASNTQRSPPPVRSSSSSISNTNNQFQTPISEHVIPSSSSSAISARTHKPKTVIKATSGSRVPPSTSQARIGTLKQMLVENDDADIDKTNNKTTAPGSRTKPIIPASSRVLVPRRGQV